MHKTAWGVALALAIFVAAWIYRGDSEISPEKRMMMDMRTESHDGPRQGADTVLAIAPGVASKPSTPQPSRLSPLMREYKTSLSYKSLYDRLAASTARSPEDMWVLAEILERCMWKGKAPAPPATRQTRVMEAVEAETLKRFTESISEKDPGRARRIAAFERVRADRCAGLREVNTSEAEIAELRERAAMAGDPKARVAALSREVWEINKGRVAAGTREISDAQVNATKELMASGDPDAIQRAAQLLSGYGNFSLRAGPEETEIDPEIFSNAWTLVACDLGALCGPEGEYLANACAYRGYCDASGIRDYLFYYANSPFRSQQLARYYEGARAASNGDWSYFTAVKGPPPSQAMWSYRDPGPAK